MIGLMVTGGEVGQSIIGDGSVVARQQGVWEQESMGLLAEVRKLVFQAGLEDDVAIRAALPGRSFGLIIRASGAADLIEGCLSYSGWLGARLSRRREAFYYAPTIHEGSGWSHRY